MTKKKKIIISSIVLLAILAAGYFLLSTNNSPKTYSEKDLLEASKKMRTEPYQPK